MPDCRVSIVVPARNAASSLGVCLGALKAEPLEGAELIVVSDASTDDTEGIAASMGARVLRLDRNSGPSRARNLGAREACGEYLFFVDADVAVRPGAVARVREFLDRNPGAAAVFGSYDADPVEKGTLTQYRNLLHHHVHQKGRREASTFWSGCGAIRRSVFLEMGGFDELDYPLCIEDIELGYRLRRAGHAVMLDRELLCKHLKRWTVLSVLKTDVFCRAVPWTRLNLLRKVSPDDLNIRRSQKVSVLLTGLSAVALLLSLVDPRFLALWGLAVLSIIALNGHLFAYFWRCRGLAFALACVPLHLLYFFYSGLSYLYVWLGFRLHYTVHDGNTTFRGGGGA